ncbi:hypothetical protein [Cellulomonas biazotea]|nr:hypothetical protein [Cellulomonas biazotea]
MRDYFAAVARWGYPLSDVEVLVARPTTPHDGRVDAKEQDAVAN